MSIHKQGILERAHKHCFAIHLAEHPHLAPVQVWANTPEQARVWFFTWFPCERIASIETIRTRTEPQLIEAQRRVRAMLYGREDWDNLPGDFA